MHRIHLFRSEGQYAVSVSQQLILYLKVSLQSIDNFQLPAYNQPYKEDERMNILNFSENIIKLRYKKGITQEELADFVGVTKASVSKWETKQSLPDIMLLPRLAAYFDVTVDELLGYEPNLSREQIQKIYFDFTKEFAEQPFEEVMEKSRQLVKKYYSCSPFLFQVCVLWMNHATLAPNPQMQTEILEEAARLCSHIISDCREIPLCNDALLLKASIDLLCGRTQEVIDTLEEILNPYHYSFQGETILVQAYAIAGQKEKANRYSQFGMYTHLLSLVSGAVQYLSLHAEDMDSCEETIHRIDCLMKLYSLENLHHNTAAQFHYQTAVICCIHGRLEEALDRLKKFASITDSLLECDKVFLHGDQYFDAIDPYFEQSDLGGNLVRAKKVIADSVVQALENPVFQPLESSEDYRKIKQIFLVRGESL